MGRRREKNNQRFFYDGYLQVADNTGNAYAWDVMEPIATRPLVWTKNDLSSYYDFDGNKNVSEVIAADGAVSAHYEYAPFGAVTTQHGEAAAANPWRFSSEYAEDDTATVYYNYRPYEPVAGRWLNRDPMDEDSCQLLLFCINNPINSSDFNGLLRVSGSGSYTWRNPTPIPGLFVNITLAVDVMLYSCCDTGNVKKNMVSVTGGLTIAAAVGAEFHGVVRAKNSRGSKCYDAKRKRYVKCGGGWESGISVDIISTNNNSDLGLDECETGIQWFVAIVGSVTAGLPLAGGFSGKVYWPLYPASKVPDAGLSYDSSAVGMEATLGVQGGLIAQFEAGKYVEVPIP